MFGEGGGRVWGVGCGEEKGIIVDSGESEFEFSIEHLNLKERALLFLSHPLSGNLSPTGHYRQQLHPNSRWIIISKFCESSAKNHPTLVYPVMTFKATSQIRYDLVT